MSNTVVNIEEIQEKLVEKLRDSGWAGKLKAFIQSSEFEDILQKLHDLKEEGKRFTPPLKQVFRAFEECPYSELKVVIVGQDPYPQFGVADGIAFSCGNTGTEQPSLKYMFNAIEETVHQGFPTYHDPNLVRWSKQGVLLLNTALTVEVNSIGSHYELWKNFTTYLIDVLSYANPGLIWVFMGKKAQELEPLVGSNHYKFMISHPASAAYAKQKRWDCENVFEKINDILEKNNGPEFKIIW